jgi:hypothetical protein
MGEGLAHKYKNIIYRCYSQVIRAVDALGDPTGSELHNFSGATPEAVLGLLSRNCTPRRGVGSAFRAHLRYAVTQG